MVKKGFRKFDGNFYKLSNKASNKENAERDADMLKTRGLLARITKADGYRYCVWYRRKK
jgi:hypothetical protein